tara:strand:- start:31 stop:1917 length:1887 start_codon:yes stop_codon:yes gene_type:complete
MVKAKKRRGIKALGRRKSIGGMERQILNPATGKYVSYIGPKQEAKMYSPKALAEVEKKSGAQKKKAADLKKKAQDESGVTARRKKDQDILDQKIAGTYKPKKVDQKLIDKFNQSALGKSGDGKVSFDPSTGQYTLDAFGAKKTYSADELSKAIATKKKDAPTPPKPPKAEPKAPAKVAKGKIEKRIPTGGELEPPARVDTTPKPKAPAKAKVAARPRSREDIQIDIPEVINVPGIGEIRLSSTTPAAPKAEVKAKPKKEVKTPKKGKVREREDIRVDTPTREDIDKIIKDLDIKIPEVINIPGVGQVTIPAVSKPPVETSEEPIIGAVSDGRLDDYSPPGKPRPPGGPGSVPDRGGIFGEDSTYREDYQNLSELDKLKERFDMLTGMRFVKDPGPGHYQKIKELGDQIYALDKNFKSDYYTPSAEKGEITSMPVPSPGLPGGPIDISRDPSPDLPPAPPPVVRPPMPPPPSDVMPGDPVSAPTPPPQPRLVSVDPFKGFKDAYRPTNIIGQSFDPSVRDDYERQMQETRARMMQPGGNIMASEYPTYQTPTMAVPQTQFGGYGQPMPIAPLLPYAGLASATMPEQVERRREPASGARVNPGTGEIEPIGIAPDPRLLNLPPGVSGPIR